MDGKHEWNRFFGFAGIRHGFQDLVTNITPHTAMAPPNNMLGSSGSPSNITPKPAPKIGTRLLKVTDKTLLTYLHHPEISHRFEAMGAMLKHKKDNILLDLLRSKDARLRHVGIMAMHELWGTWRKSDEETKRRITPEMMAEVDTIIRNPEESAFNRGWAVGLLQHADLPRLRTFRDLLVDMIENGTDHGQVSAIHASTPFLTDPESYQIIFPPMMKAISTATSFPVSMSTSSKISKAMEQASPEIQAYGLKQLQAVSATQPPALVSKDTGIYVIPDGASAKR